MTPIDHIRPPPSTPPPPKVQRKNRSARDSNREQRQGSSGRNDTEKTPASDHIDKLA